VRRTRGRGGWADGAGTEGEAAVAPFLAILTNLNGINVS